MCSQDAHPNLALIRDIWSIVGPLVGISIGIVTGSFVQKRQWLCDQKKQADLHPSK
jgi:hypothetical protein